MQHSKPQKLEDDGLPDLSQNEMEFALLIASGKQQGDSYRQAWNNYSSTDKAISVMATKVRQRLGVSLWIDALKREHLSRSSYTIDDYIKELDQSIQMYAQAGAWSAHVTALKAKGAAIEVSTEHVTQGKKVGGLLDRIEQQLGPEARRKAEQRLGYTLKEHQTVQ